MNVKAQAGKAAFGFFVILFFGATILVLLPSFSRVFVDYGKPKKAGWWKPEKQEGIILEYEGYSESLCRLSDWLELEEHSSICDTFLCSIFWTVVAIFGIVIFREKETDFEWLMRLSFFVQAPLFLILLLIVSKNVFAIHSIAKTFNNPLLLTVIRKELIFKIFIDNFAMPIICILGMDVAAFLVVSTFIFAIIQIFEFYERKNLRIQFYQLKVEKWIKKITGK